MRKVIDIVCGSAIYLISGMFFVALALPSRAQQISFGTGVVCNQLEDVERYMALYNEGDSFDGVLDDVNHGAERLACDVVTVAYIRGEDIKMIHVADGFGAVVKVAIVGVRTDIEWVSVPPMEKFMIVSREDQEA